MSNHDKRLDQLRAILAPPAANDEVRVERIACALGRDVASVRTEIGELQAKVRAAHATGPEAVATVLAEVTGLDAANILDEAERIARLEVA
jgi:hypothetical protein